MIRKNLLIMGVLSLTLFCAQPSVVFAQGRAFSTEELSIFNGKNGQPAYYAYEGKVYDVTGSKLWEEGEHYGLMAGSDLTGKMGDAPHGTEVFRGFAVVGTYESDTSAPAAEMEKTVSPEKETTAYAQAAVSSKPWYATRIRWFGISILGWTGILLGVFFVLTFGTCFAMPWAKLPLPWRGLKPGADALDGSDRHQPWSSIHKHFVWATVILGIVHGVLGFLQLIGIYL